MSIYYKNFFYVQNLNIYRINVKFLTYLFAYKYLIWTAITKRYVLWSSENMFHSSIKVKRVNAETINLKLHQSFLTFCSFCLSNLMDFWFSSFFFFVSPHDRHNYNSNNKINYVSVRLLLCSFYLLHNNARKMKEEEKK